MYDIVILDSGVNCDHPLFKTDIPKGFTIDQATNGLKISDGLIDEYGHGTAMYGIIKSNTSNAKILNIRISKTNGELSEAALCQVLQFVYNNIPCAFLNLSLGLRTLKNKKALYSVCCKLRERGTIIVAAFDNEGCQTYPACFDCVVGVESGNSKTVHKLEYIWKDNSEANIIASGSTQKVPWAKPDYVFMGGNSIACAHATSILYTLLANTHLSSVESKLNFIREASKYIIQSSYDNKTVLSSELFAIKKVALFPFNKEMHALIRFHEKLPVQIKAVYDIRQSGKVGSLCTKFIGDGEENNCTLKVSNIDQIQWKDIDTLVIGHCSELSDVLGYNIRDELIKQADTHGVNIYCYDPLVKFDFSLIKNNIKLFSPQLTATQVPTQQSNKLNIINKPVIGIFGTSSRQGKYTLQCSLRYELERLGYNVGCIGTEPNSFLLGMEACIPLGYNAYINVTDQDVAQIVNKAVNDLSEHSDIVIASGQANSIPFAYYTKDLLPVKQHPFILGLQPDIILLCVNAYDSEAYISNTIKYLEGAGQCCVSGLVLFPLTYYSDWRSYKNSKKQMNKEEMQEVLDKFGKTFQRPIYVLNDLNSIHTLANDIIISLS